MSKIADNAEKWLWQNLRMYLMTYPTCLLDNLLKIKDPESDVPAERYEDFFNQFNQHMQLGSYSAGQPAQFNNVPYVTVDIRAYANYSCSTRVVMTFDVLFTTDSPRPNAKTSTQYVGNSSEAVATFRANMANAVADIMKTAYDPEEYPGESPTMAFFDRLRDQTIADPRDASKTALWKYNLRGWVEDDGDMTQVYQLKKEDRSSGLLMFSISYDVTLDRMYGDGFDCGC